MVYVELGWLYYDLNDKQKAIEYFTMAYNLSKSIGAEGLAQEVRKNLIELGVNPESFKPEKAKQKEKT